MYSYISCFLKTSILVILCNDYLKKKYEHEYNIFFINVSYKTIYLYSKLQLYFYNIKNKINKLIDSSPQLKKLVNDIYNKNTNFVDIIQFNNKGSLYLKRYKDNNDYLVDDNILCLFADVKNNYTNYIISRKRVFQNNYEISNTKFLMVELNLGDIKIKIDLKTDKENYYIVSNVLDKNFFLYYMFNYFHLYHEKIPYEKLLSLIDASKLTIIDDKVNKLDIDFSKNGSITILKDGFTVNHTCRQLPN